MKTLTRGGFVRIALVAVAAMLGGGTVAQAAITVLGSAWTPAWTANNVTTQTLITPTVSAGSNGMIFVTIGGESGPNIGTFTWDVDGAGPNPAVPLPLNLAVNGSTGTAGNNGGLANIYYLADPTGAYATSGTLGVTLSGTGTIQRFAMSFMYATGVGELEDSAANPSTASGDQTVGPINVSPGALVVGAAGASNGYFTAGGGIVGGATDSLIYANPTGSAGSGYAATYELSAGGAARRGGSLAVRRTSALASRHSRPMHPLSA